MMKKQKQERISRGLFSSLSRPEHVHTSSYVAIRRFPAIKGMTKPIFMVTISKKEIPTAVKRNLMKRRYRHIVQKLFSGSISPAVIQCIVKKNSLTATHQELLADANLGLPRLR